MRAMHDVIRAVKSITKNQPRYRRAERYYDGEFGEVWTNAELARRFADDADLFMINICKRPNRAVRNRLEITSVTVEDVGDTDSDTTPAESAVSPLQALLDEQWRLNELDLELPSVFEKTGEYGDYYLSVWPDPTNEDAFEVVAYSPLTTRAFYDPENPRRCQFVASTWLDEKDYRRVTIWYHDRIERWISTKPEEEGYADDITGYEHYYDDEGEWPEPNPWGMPIFHLRTSRPFGRPLHADIYGAQNILTKQLSTMTAATDGYGLPFRWAIKKAGTTGPAPDQHWDDDDDDDPKAPSAPAVKVRAGDMAILENVDGVGQLSPAEIRNFLDPIEMTMRMAATVSDTPLNYFDPSATVSGVSRREDSLPLIKNVEYLQLAYGGALSRLLQLGLKMITGQDTTVRITWAEAQLVDEKEQWEIIKAKIDTGMPLRQALIEAGYVDKAVDRFLELSGEQAYTQRVETLLKIAQVAREFGTAQTLGTIEEDDVRKLIATLVGEGDQDGEDAS